MSVSFRWPVECDLSADGAVGLGPEVGKQLISASLLFRLFLLLIVTQLTIVVLVLIPSRLPLRTMKTGQNAKQVGPDIPESRGTLPALPCLEF